MPADRSGDVDAVVVGSGPNGLVAANVLVDRGWEVLVLEALPEPGGAVRSDTEVTAPGFTCRTFSAFYPLAAAVAGPPCPSTSTATASGGRRRRALLAHPTPDGPTLVIDPDLDVTAASLDRFAPAVVTATPGAPCSRSLTGSRRPCSTRCSPRSRPCARRSGSRAWRDRGASSTCCSSGSARPGAGAPALRGRRRCAAVRRQRVHTDLLPESASSAIYGWLLSSLAQQVGWPVPVGGAGELTAALVRRLEANGGRVECGAR